MKQSGLIWIIIFLVTVTAFIAFKPSPNYNRKTITPIYSKEKKDTSKTENWKIWNKLFKNGNPYITNYRISDLFDKQNFAIAQNHEKVMFFANKKGVLIFDGVDWKLIRTPGFANTLVYNEKTSQVFVGCNENFGFIQKDERGLYSYQSLSANYKNIGDFTTIEITENNLFFYSDKIVARVSLTNSKDKSFIPAPSNNSFTGIMNLKGTIYVNISGKGLHKFEQEQIIPVEKCTELAYNKILFSCKFDEKNILIGTDSSRLYLFNGEKISAYRIQAQAYLSESILSGGINVSFDEFALATLTGGALLIEKSTGNTIYTINYQNGLPDDEIYSIGIDKHHGLWVAHEFGISRIDYSIPVKKFSTYPGITGNILSVIDFDSTIYVGTTEGLFYLTEIKDLKEYEIIVKKPVQTKIENEVFTNKTIIDPEQAKPKDELKKEDQQKKKSFFKKLKEKANSILEKLKLKKKNDEGKKDTIINTEKISQTNEQKIDLNNFNNEEEKTVSENLKKKQVENQTQTFSKKLFALQSINLAYKKVEGFKEKCKQLLKYNNHILALTNNGLYEINGNKANSLFKSKSINQVVQSSQKNKFYLATTTGIQIVEYHNKKWIVAPFDGNEFFSENAYTLVEDNNNLWLGAENFAYYIKLDSNSRFVGFNPYVFESEFSEQVIVRMINTKPVFFMASSVYTYDDKKDSMALERILLKDYSSDTKMIYNQNNITWFYKNNKWTYFSDLHQFDSLQIGFLNLFDNIQNIYVDAKHNIWVIDGRNSLSKILAIDYSKYAKQEFDVNIASAVTNTGVFLDLSKIELDYENNTLKFKIIAPFYIKSEATQYQYLVEGLSKKWSEWSSSSEITFPFVPDGKYLLRVRAKNIYGEISNEKQLEFTIHPPFWKSVWFYLILLALTVLGLYYSFYFLIRWKEEKLFKEKQNLEQKVNERTVEIEQKNKEILDSIQYASRIQLASLPPKEIIDEIIPQHFIFNRPKNLISGDFYWVKKIDSRYKIRSSDFDENKIDPKTRNFELRSFCAEVIMIAAADCTGHGVPGAMLSMLGIAFLNDIATKMENPQANKMLDELRKNIKQSLHQSKEAQHKDGMDISLCIIDVENLEMQYSGAYNPAIIVRNERIIELEADRMPVGIYSGKERPFNCQYLKLKKNDMIYIFSDGFIDQVGGDQGRKFLRSNFRRLLQIIHDEPIEEQEKLLSQTFDDWRGNYNQIDDVLVIGFRI